MSDRFGRFFTYGPPGVLARQPETWTDEVRRLYERLEQGDATALAPLLEQDLEFIRDMKAFCALISLKFDPDYPAAKARSQLTKVANVIRRRPGKRRAKLPYEDQLRAELRWLTQWIADARILEVKKDSDILTRRVHEALWEEQPKRRSLLAFAYVEGGAIERELDSLSGPEQSTRFAELQEEEEDRRLAGEMALWQAGEASRLRLKEALLAAARPGKGYVRTPRSWALNALAVCYGVDTRIVEKLLSRAATRRGNKKS